VSPTISLKGDGSYTELLDALVSALFTDNVLVFLSNSEESVYNIVTELAVKLVIRH
jgi:uncharacterized protein YllA (UPF0747 family)